MLFRQNGFDLIAQNLHAPMQMLSTDARTITGEKIIGREREHKSALNLQIDKLFDGVWNVHKI